MYTIFVPTQAGGGRLKKDTVHWFRLANSANFINLSWYDIYLLQFQSETFKKLSSATRCAAKVVCS